VRSTDWFIEAKPGSTQVGVLEDRVSLKSAATGEEMVAQLAARPERLQLGGELRPMTILFCDIRNFTTLAEGTDPRTLTSFLNSFLSPMTEIITAQKGTIDRYLGDGIMAFLERPA
jgi:adenylate cyclase